MTKETTTKPMTKGSFDKQIASITKELGLSVTAFKRYNGSEQVDMLPTGILELDEMLNGGIAFGTIVEFFGRPGCGKTWLTYKVAGSAQDQGLSVLLIDSEGAFNSERAQAVGMKLDDTFAVCNEYDNGEQALEICAKAAESGVFGLIIIDSAAALVPKTILDSQLGKGGRIAAHAAMMSLGLAKIMHALKGKRTIVIFVNQVRTGMTTGPSYGPPPETTTGGYAMHHYVSYRFRLAARTSQEAKIMDGNRLIGNLTSCQLKKTRYGMPGLSCDFPIYFVERKDKFLEFLSLAETKKKVRYFRKKYLYPYVDKTSEAEFFTDNIEEFKDYLTSNSIVLKIAQELKINDPEEYQNKIIEDINRIRMEETEKILETEDIEEIEEENEFALDEE